jgi:hypothetical protein
LARFQAKGIRGQRLPVACAFHSPLVAAAREPFARAKAEFDQKLAKDYGIQPADLRPWHYHDPFFQEAPAVYDVYTELYGKTDDELLPPEAAGPLKESDRRALDSGTGLSLDAWVFHTQLADVIDLARAFPGTNIIMGHVGGVLGVVGYAWVHDHLRLFTIPYGSVTAWVALFLGVDFSYYVFHRVSHRVGFMWAAHVVHHQSEEYNLTVALRQSWLDQLVEWIFYTPFALLGFPPAMFLAVWGVNTVYAFWPHTRAIGRLGPFEWIFNTPSAHRVHHAVNPR